MRLAFDTPKQQSGFHFLDPPVEGATALPGARVLRIVKVLVAFLTFAFLFGSAIRAGWTRTEADFANYYTAALSLRQGQPLREYYDWTCFARQLNYDGFERALGNYTPQTPLTMLPLVPLSVLPPQRAKQVWVLLNAILFLLTIWLLSRITRLNVAEIWLLAIPGYFALHANFVYGQYYVFLLFLLTLAFYFLRRQNYALGGAVIGAAFALKLYGGPFLLYFVARREWKALVSMLLVTLLFAGLAVALFGVADVQDYASHILPRTLEGSSIDPYAPGMPTLSSLLWHLFRQEPESNPHPLWDAPWLFFFLRTFLSLLIISFVVAQTSSRRTTSAHDFAWFTVAALLLSTSTGSYSFIVLLLPLVLLFDERHPGVLQSVAMVLCFAILTLPPRPAWLFAKVWLLLAAYLWVGWPYLRRLSPRLALAIIALAAVTAAIDAGRHMNDYANEPGRQFAQLVPENGAVFSSFPAVSRTGIFYQSMGTDRYVLRWLHDNQNEELAFQGHALQPRIAPDGTAIDFELVANRHSTMMRFDPATRATTPLAASVPTHLTRSSLSPNGKWLAYESAQDGPVHIWLRDLSTGRDVRLTGGNCNSVSPAWDLDSKALVFASDCDRAFGLSALYRAPVQPQ